MPHEKSVFKALTILEPYASLIALPDTHPRAKRVENRTWKTHYRGPLLIHAGRNWSCMDAADEYALDREPLIANMGKVIAVASLVACVSVRDVRRSAYVKRAYPWLRDHEHTEGPYCWVLQDVRRLRQPIELRGRTSLWEVPAELVSGLF